MLNSLDLIPAPYNLVAKIALPVLALGSVWIAGDVHGHRAGMASVNAAYAKSVAKSLAVMRRAAERINVLNGQYASARQQQITEEGSIRNATAPLIVRPIYSITCIDADGAGLLDRARANGNRTIDPGQSARGARRIAGHAKRG